MKNIIILSRIEWRDIKLNTLQIGKLGELEKQKRFLELGYDKITGHLTTDSGIDLVVLLKSKYLTLQVKTMLVAAKAGGKGPLAIDWYAPVNNQANYFALYIMRKKKYGYLQ